MIVLVETKPEMNIGERQPNASANKQKELLIIAFISIPRMNTIVYMKL